MIRRIVGEGKLWVSEYVITYEGQRACTVNIMEFRDGEVAHETQYFADPFDAPARCARWVEREARSTASSDSMQPTPQNGAAAAGRLAVLQVQFRCSLLIGLEQFLELFHEFAGSNRESPCPPHSPISGNKSRHSGLHHRVQSDACGDAVSDLLHGVFRQRGNVEILLDMRRIG